LAQVFVGPTWRASYLGWSNEEVVGVALAEGSEEPQLTSRVDSLFLAVTLGSGLYGGLGLG
jgi:hypothetical protein